MDELYDLKKALLQTRIAMHQNGLALADLQLKVLEEENAKTTAESENGAALQAGEPKDLHTPHGRKGRVAR